MVSLASPLHVVGTRPPRTLELTLLTPQTKWRPHGLRHLIPTNALRGKAHEPGLRQHLAALKTDLAKLLLE